MSWPQRIIPPGFGEPNFRERSVDRQAGKAERRAGMSEAYLALIRQLPCALTLRVDAIEPHHLKQGTGERGAQMRSTDQYAIPLTHEWHMELERQGSRNEQTWLGIRGLEDPLGLARALWTNRGNLLRMQVIVFTTASYSTIAPVRAEAHRQLVALGIEPARVE